MAARRLFDAISEEHPREFVCFKPKNWVDRFKSRFLHELWYRSTLLNSKEDYRSYNYSGLLDLKLLSEDGLFHFHWIGNNFISLEDIGRTQAPCVLTLHDSWFLNDNGSHYDRNSNNLFVKYLDEKICKRKKRITNIRAFIVPSKWLYHKALSSDYCKGSNVYLIPNALDTDLFKPDFNLRSKHQKRVVIYCNSFDDYLKGGDLVLDFLNTNVDQLSNVEIILFGSKRPDAIAKIFPTVKVLGFLNESQIVRLYQSANISMNFSRSENLSQVLTESASCGLALVAFNVGGNSDVIEDGVNGTLIVPFDLDSMKTALLSCLDNSDSMGERSRLTAQNHWNKDKIVQDHLAVYQEIAKG